MRITQGMLSNNMLRNLSKSYENLGTYMDQLSTGKKVNRPSDDPVVAMKGMNYRSQVTEIEQYQRNTGEVRNWMDNSDAAMDKATQALQRLRELALQASNDSYEEGQRENIAEEVDQLKQHLVNIANTSVNGKFLFNGTDTNNKPVTTDAAGIVNKVSTNDRAVTIQVANGTDLKSNINPSQVFGSNLFADIEKFSESLRSGQGNEALQQSIANIDTHINNVVNERADLGARMNRLDLIENRLGEQEVIAKRIMSSNEDADMEEVIMNLKTQESVQRAALAAGARIIQPTLMDFLR
ncbi:flagellar hook-associated protein FlgL [Aquibacillus sp. 3ASR75-11]|uniref:Flagellar hook-associated protein FlgL n=1 Tax=Terrihalobacillus insolitus TaxID=2950438 RepID=A0A9X3WNS9_9BACI|nr:flagellar hook-associated protein FlgL [Terrihalobacillus insolitus]MDC3412226.1 flagellar hook-associated protein FlgL [Terrihalobacillus insolitus]MDC3423080.1 flagellar hook-associated protein FlgL [Terrihalobacillus insolitus]